MSKPFQVMEFREPETNSMFRIAPERGGIMTSLVLDGRELLFMNQDTFEDPTANIRGGNPVLFPVCGQLDKGGYEWNGIRYSMKSHGFVRDMKWDVVQQPQSEINANAGASITLQVGSTPETIGFYPFQFELRFTYTLKEATLHILQDYLNVGDTDMPMYAGFHPYFISDNLRIAYDTDAVTSFDYGKLLDEPFTGVVDLTGRENAILLSGAKSGRVTFKPVAEEKAITMTYGPEFKYLMLWTVPGQPFVCVEPWMARPKEISRKQELVFVKPGGKLSTTLTIGLEP